MNSHSAQLSLDGARCFPGFMRCLLAPLSEQVCAVRVGGVAAQRTSEIFCVSEKGQHSALCTSMPVESLKEVL